MGEMITLKEWAAKHGITHDSARQKALRGGFETAKKLGRDWVIDSDEQPSDKRYKDVSIIHK